MNVGIIGCGLIGRKRALNIQSSQIHTVCDIDLSKARDDKILNFAAESLPFMSEIGLLSAKPSFFALLSASEKFFPLFSITDKI